MSPRVDQIVVFDTARESRELRYERTRVALEQGILPYELTLRVTGDRQECLEWLMLDEEHHSLLLCDMHDDRRDVGNIGARLLRTVARNDDLAPQVWRVLWSEHDHPMVIADIEPYAHAFLWFDLTDRGSELLALAIGQVVSEPPSGPAGSESSFHWFAPRGLTAEQYIDGWRTTLQGLLVGGRELKHNDEVAVASILRGVPDNVTNERLAAARAAVAESERRNYCASINEFLERIDGDKRQAREAVIDALVTQSQAGIATNLMPDMIERAERLMERSPLPDQLRRYGTLLTEGEDAVARTLVALYRQHLTALRPRKNDEIRRYRALDLALRDERLVAVFARPDLADCAATIERQAETVSYVIGVYNDTARSRGGDTLSVVG